MVELFYCKISTINYTAGTANVTIEERENQMITGVPFLASCYEMPKVGETVAVIFDTTGGKIGRGVILGNFFSRMNQPGESGEGLFYKEFSDGSSIKYDPSSKSMELTVKKIVVDEVEYKKATQKG